MGGCIYLLKARLDPPGSARGESFSCAWAQRVRRIGGQLAAENIQVPVVSRGSGRWEMRGHSLPAGRFEGHAYPVRAPRWFLGDPPLSSTAGGADQGAALEEKLLTTPLGRMCLHPEVRAALAQDKLAAELEPVLRVPDLLAGEDGLAEAWRRERPAAAAEADAVADVGGATSAERLWRRRLRIAALRRLDAAAVGREVYAPCPAYFGEPYLGFRVAPDLTFKAGPVRRAEFWPNPEGEARSRAWRSDRARVAAVESRLLPVLVAGGDAALALWLALEPLRRFEIGSRTPLDLSAAGPDEDAAPAGWEVRIRPETMRELGGSYRTLARAGLSPYIAAPFRDYCATREDLLAAWAEDPAGLARAKWGEV